MPVADIDVTDKVRKTQREAGCYNQPRNGIPCRQVGRRIKPMGAGHYLWGDLAECEGCSVVRDREYIGKSRYAIDLDSTQHMKADQRC